MNPQISLESKGLDTGDKSFDDVMRSSNFRNIILNRASSLGQDSEDSFDTFLGRALDFGIIDWFHHSGIGC